MDDVSLGSPAHQEAAMPPTVGWDEVEPMVSEAFNIWSFGDEDVWARLAWDHLAKAGLTSRATEEKRTMTMVRFLVLASFYRDWCMVACDERQDDEPRMWLGAIEYDPLVVTELGGVDYDPEVDDEWESVEEALNTLLRRARRRVVGALSAGFGGTNDLFLALWKSSHQTAVPLDAGQAGDIRDATDEDEGDEEDQEEDGFEDDAAILNNVDTDKLAGYQWIDSGCESYGPTRAWSDGD